MAIKHPCNEFSFDSCYESREKASLEYFAESRRIKYKPPFSLTDTLSFDHSVKPSGAQAQRNGKPFSHTFVFCRGGCPVHTPELYADMNSTNCLNSRH